MLMRCKIGLGGLCDEADLAYIPVAHGHKFFQHSHIQNKKTGKGRSKAMEI
jgi:hypothetical protein